MDDRVCWSVLKDRQIIQKTGTVLGLTVYDTLCVILLDEPTPVSKVEVVFVCQVQLLGKA